MKKSGEKGGHLQKISGMLQPSIFAHISDQKVELIYASLQLQILFTI